jgi:peptide/nickel transport system permease protein
MQRYIVVRLLQLVLVLFGVSTLVFVLLRLSGDPVTLFVTEDMTTQQVADLRQRLGFNDPVWVQYTRFLGQVVQGDFGSSLRLRQPALALVLERLPATMELTLAGLFLSTAVGVPLGVVAAAMRGSWLDKATMGFAVLGQGMPVFWLGILLILIFAADLHLLPSGGRGTAAQLIMPTLTVALYTMARTARLTRSSMLEVLGQDFVRTAHAKGLANSTVLVRHALRAVAVSIVTIVGLTFSTLFGGAVITETIFSWPGVGRLLIQAVGFRDYPLVQAAVFVIALFVAVANLITDLLYAYLDPRIRYG